MTSALHRTAKPFFQRVGTGKLVPLAPPTKTSGIAIFSFLSTAATAMAVPWVMPGGSSSAETLSFDHVTGFMVGTPPAQVTEMPAARGLPPKLVSACTDPDGSQSPASRSGSSWGVAPPHQRTGRGGRPRRRDSRTSPPLRRAAAWDCCRSRRRRGTGGRDGGRGRRNPHPRSIAASPSAVSPQWRRRPPADAAACAGRGPRTRCPAPPRSGPGGVPPRLWTTRRVMVRPSPTPRPGPLVEKKGVKSFCTTSGGMPGPLSFTETTSVAVLDPAAEQDPPGLLGHGLDGVLDQVGEHLAELLRDALERPVALQVEVDLHVAAGGREHDPHHGAGRRPGVVRDHLPLVAGAPVPAHQLHGGADALHARVGHPQELVDPGRQPVDLRLLGRVERPLAGRAAQAEHLLGVEADAPERVLEVVERVVDLVGQAGRHHLQRLHALREHEVGGLLLRLHQLARRGEQLLRREGLGEVGAHPGLQPLHPVVELAARGEHDDGDVAGRGLLAQPPRQREAVDARHHEVGDHQAGALAQHEVEPLQAVGRGQHLELAAQRHVHELDDVRMVLDHHRRVGAGLLVGVALDHPPLGGLLDVEEPELAARRQLDRPVQARLAAGSAPSARAAASTSGRRWPRPLGRETVKRAPELPSLSARMVPP